MKKAHIELRGLAGCLFLAAIAAFASAPIGLAWTIILIIIRNS